MSKGDLTLWGILNEKLDLLRGTGRLTEALRVAQTALELAHRAFPPGDPAVALSLEKIGQLHDQSGDRAAAKPYLEQAHKLLAHAAPRDQLTVYQSARRLAFVCDSLEQGEEAVGYYEEAIEAGMQLADLSHGELGTMLNNMALIYRNSDQPEAAEPYYLRALELYQKQLGPEDRDLAAVLNNLAVFYTNQQRFAESEQMHLHALSIREKMQPPQPADIAQSRCNLAVVYHSLRNFGRAAELYRSSLELWENASPTPPADYDIVVSNYADLLRATGKNRQAQQLEARARKRRV